MFRSGKVAVAADAADFVNMPTEIRLALDDVPISIRKSIVQDLKAENKPLPSQVILGIEHGVVLHYRPIYTYDGTNSQRSDLSLDDLLSMFKQE